MRGGFSARRVISVCAVDHLDTTALGARVRYTSPAVTAHWDARFGAFIAERTRVASAAVLPPYRTEVASPPRHALAIGNDWSSHLFDGPFFVTPPYKDRPACSLVFVASAEGNTGASDPGSLGGGVTDQHLIYEGLSRVAADAVLAGAETMRGGNLILSTWHPELVALRQRLGKPRHPVQIIASLQGVDLESGLLYNVPDVAVIILTVAAGAARMDAALRPRPWIRLVTMAAAGDLRNAFTLLRALGIQIVSCIGGRTLARGLFENGLVDDLYLTRSPRPGGEPNTPLPTASWGSELVVRKRGTGTETGVVFEHMHASD